jgi:flagellar biosynthetic protein FlhB
VVSAVVFTAAMVFLAWRGWPSWVEQFRLDRALLLQAARAEGTPASMWSLVDKAIRESMVAAAPYFLTLVVAAIAGNVLQTGPVLSAEPLKPDWSRVNPATGLKQLFSTRTLFNGLRAVVKLAFLAAVAWAAVKSLVPHFHLLARLSPGDVVRRLLDDLASLGLKMALALVLIALVDLAYTRREFAKRMRMSRRELRDELKHREGDPKIRARLRELRRELLKKATSLRKTRDADVLITNPTHLAVALRYVHGEMESPQLVAKGAGFLAAAMRNIAARHRIPVVQSPGLARALFHRLPLDRHVPPELYGPVARILVWVLALREARAAAVTPLRPAPAAPGGAPWTR